MIISLTLLFLSADAVQAAGGVYLLVELIAVVIFAIRVVPTSIRIGRAGGGSARHLAASSIFVLVATAIFLYVIFRFIQDPSIAGDPSSIAGVLTASDHAAFIGVVTNLVLGIGLALTADRQEGGSRGEQLAFWLMNVGLAIFLVGLIADSAVTKRVGSPMMGIGILIALAIVAMRLRASNLSATET